MTTLEELREVLLVNPTVIGLVGTRIYPGVLPQAVQLPAVVFNIISTTPENVLEGAPTLAGQRVQIDSYGKKYGDAHEVDDALRSVLEVLGTPELAAWRIDSRDLYDDVRQAHRVSTDYAIQRAA